MVYDIERIGAMVSDVQKYFKDLESMAVRGISDLDDKKNFYSLSMLLFSIINRAIDLGEEIISAENLGTPATYKDIFQILQKNRVIDKDLGKKLSGLVSYRNLLAHEYHGITERDLFNVYARIDIVKVFVEKVRERVNPTK
jgi:uncharacterized protein YutE (UPF0331/DUF86 family)